MYKEKVDKFYSGFFYTAAAVAASPYIAVLFKIGAPKDDNADGEWILRLIIGGTLCVVFTIIPVLPVLTILTSTIALIGAIIVGIGALVAYPVACAMDACLSDIPAYAAV